MGTPQELGEAILDLDKFMRILWSVCYEEWKLIEDSVNNKTEDNFIYIGDYARYYTLDKLMDYSSNLWLNLHKKTFVHTEVPIASSNPEPTLAKHTYIQFR